LTRKTQTKLNINTNDVHQTGSFWFDVHQTGSFSFDVHPFGDGTPPPDETKPTKQQKKTNRKKKPGQNKLARDTRTHLLESQREGDPCFVFWLQKNGKPMSRAGDIPVQESAEKRKANVPCGDGDRNACATAAKPKTSTSTGQPQDARPAVLQQQPLQPQQATDREKQEKGQEDPLATFAAFLGASSPQLLRSSSDPTPLSRSGTGATNNRKSRKRKAQDDLPPPDDRVGFSSSDPPDPTTDASSPLDRLLSVDNALFMLVMNHLPLCDLAHMTIVLYKRLQLGQRAPILSSAANQPHETGVITRARKTALQKRQKVEQPPLVSTWHPFSVFFRHRGLDLSHRASFTEAHCLSLLEQRRVAPGVSSLDEPSSLGCAVSAAPLMNPTARVASPRMIRIQHCPQLGVSILPDLLRQRASALIVRFHKIKVRERLSDDWIAGKLVRPELQRLVLNVNHLEDNHVLALAKAFPNLQTLVLEGEGRLTHKSLRTVSALASLRTLQLAPPHPPFSVTQALMVRGFVSCRPCCVALRCVALRCRYGLVAVRWCFGLIAVRWCCGLVAVRGAVD
jgi:hypothetical protein